jgi:regulatory protein YycI of two-component signal transduction system YycFG
MVIEFVTQSLGLYIMIFVLLNTILIKNFLDKMISERRDSQLKFVQQKSRLLRDIDADTTSSNGIIMLERIN